MVEMSRNVVVLPGHTAPTPAPTRLVQTNMFFLCLGRYVPDGLVTHRLLAEVLCGGKFKIIPSDENI